MNAEPFTLNGQPFDCCDPHYGPVYPKLPGLDKYRRVANSGAETPEDARAYGRAVGEAFRSLNAISAGRPISTACTAETDAKCRARILAAFEAGIRADRARRTDAQIIALYHKTMERKRRREAERETIARQVAMDTFANCHFRGEPLHIAPPPVEMPRAPRAAPTPLARTKRIDPDLAAIIAEAKRALAAELAALGESI